MRSDLRLNFCEVAVNGSVLGDGTGQRRTREQLPWGTMARSRGTPWYVEGQQQRVGDQQQQPCFKCSWGGTRLSRVSAVKADLVDDCRTGLRR